MRTVKTVDTLLQLKDAGLVAASAAAQVSAADKVLDLGTGHAMGAVMVDITAIEVDTGNEKYEIEVQLSSSATFATDVVVKSILRVGDSSVAFNTVDSVVGRYMVETSNEYGGTLYRYMRLYTRIAGTIATGINYAAYLVKGNATAGNK
jgi:hypothetical protein